MHVKFKLNKTQLSFRDILINGTAKFSVVVPARRFPGSSS